ncbi:MAG: VWA domain-containing protein [Flammeovirgaceae bacterium]
MQQLQFEYSPLFILLCGAVGLGYAFILYRAKSNWGKRTNQILFAVRTLCVSLLCLLLIGPILKLTTNQIEKPTYVFLIDNSTSIREVLDSAKRQQLQNDLQPIGDALRQQGFDVRWQNLGSNPSKNFVFTNTNSDITSALRETVAAYEGKNLAGITLVSDGIYNTGTSPLYTPINLPINTVGIGDSALRADLVLKNTAFNKIAYQGNKFPIRAEVLAQNLPNENISVTITKNGNVVDQQTKNTGNNANLNFDFLLEANEKGMQRFDVAITPLLKETNLKNNRASIFIDVVEGKKKILLIAPAPHPDIKALRAVVEKNSNYEFHLHIPSLTEAPPPIVKPGGAELVIFHQAVDESNRTTALLQTMMKSKTSILIMVGSQSNLRQLQPNGWALSFESMGQLDEVTPVVNGNFRDFTFLENTNTIVARYPPAGVPFGKFSFPLQANVLLYQRVGSVATNRPMLFTWTEDNRKLAAFIGEGIWRWRLQESMASEKTEVFDDVFLKLIQYLTTLDDKRKFRFFPLQNELAENQSIIFEAQVYNDLFERVYGNKIEIELKDEQGKSTHYDYVTSAAGARYQIGNLIEGVYRYTAKTKIGNQREEVQGQFLVTAANIEAQNLIADFDLLRKLAKNTGGKFYSGANLPKLQQDFQLLEAKGLIHTDESFNPLISLKGFFFLLLLLISVEWFLRKYSGGY